MSTDNDAANARVQKILIIDDDPVTAAVYRRRLEDAKFVVHVANDATAGLVALQVLKPDLVLLDLHMPDRNGLDWLGTVRKIERFKHLPVVVLTAQAGDSPLVQTAMDADVTGVLSKQEWGPEAVVAAVKWVAAKRPLRAAA